MITISLTTQMLELAISAQRTGGKGIKDGGLLVTGICIDGSWPPACWFVLLVWVLPFLQLWKASIQSNLWPPNNWWVKTWDNHFLFQSLARKEGLVNSTELPAAGRFWCFFAANINLFGPVLITRGTLRNLKSMYYSKKAKNSIAHLPKHVVEGLFHGYRWPV